MKNLHRNAQIEKLLASKRGILLDISLGGTPQESSVTMSPNGDLKHDPRILPFPLPDRCVHTVTVTHVLEYLDQAQFFDFWDEVHRILRPKGICYVSGPHGGDEQWGWLSDPMHKTRVIEQTFSWLDPRLPFYATHKDLGRQTPKPWHPIMLTRVPGENGTISYNVMMQSQPAEVQRA